MYTCTPDSTLDNINKSTPQRLPCLATRGCLPTAEVRGDGIKVIVSSSAGCMAKQNHEGEMSGKGIDSPAATLLYFNGRERIEIMTSQRPTAKPRFCVACDYIDVMGGGFWEYIKAVDTQGTFEFKPNWDKIHPCLGTSSPSNFNTTLFGVTIGPNMTRYQPENIKEDMIESVTLYLVGGEDTSVVKAKKVQSPDNATLLGDVMRWKFEEDSTGMDLMAQIKYYGESLGGIFLSIKFNEAAFAGVTGFKHYDFDSPWNIHVGIYAGESDITENPEANMPSWHK